MTAQAMVFLLPTWETLKEFTAPTYSSEPLQASVERIRNSIPLSLCHSLAHTHISNKKDKNIFKRWHRNIIVRVPKILNLNLIINNWRIKEQREGHLGQDGKSQIWVKPFQKLPMSWKTKQGYQNARSTMGFWFKRTTQLFRGNMNIGLYIIC